MASDSPDPARAAALTATAASLDAALTQLEARLDALEPSAPPELIVTALAEPVQALSAAAKEAVR